MTCRLISKDPYIIVAEGCEASAFLVTPELARYAAALARQGLREARERLRREITDEPQPWMVEALPRFWSDEARAERIECRQASVERWEVDLARWEARLARFEETT
jgi:hypothetical protein